MSTQPRPDRNSSERSSEHLDPLINGHLGQANAHILVRQMQQRVDRAANSGAKSFEYWWQTPDDREAQVRVHYRVVERLVDVVAYELIEIDYRQPTVTECAAYQEEFDAEMQAGGVLWCEILSFVSESLDP